MLTKILIISFFVFPAMAESNDDEIIKNLDFFQNMEMLKEEVALSSNTTSSVQKNPSDSKAHEKSPEKKQ